MEEIRTIRELTIVYGDRSVTLSAGFTAAEAMECMCVMMREDGNVTGKPDRHA